MAKRLRVLYSKNGIELSIELDGLEERLVFTASNQVGFSGVTLKEIFDGSLAAVQSARQLQSLEDELKDIVSERAPAMLGIEDYVSKNELDKKDKEAKEDKVLREMKPYFKEDVI